MKTNKKLLSFLVAALLVFSLLPITAFAAAPYADEPTTAGEFTITTSLGGVDSDEDTTPIDLYFFTTDYAKDIELIDDHAVTVLPSDIGRFMFFISSLLISSVNVFPVA